MPPRRTERRHDLSRLMTAQPGQKVDKALILSNVGAKLPGRKTGSRKPVAAPWGRYVGGDGSTVVLAFSLPPRVLWPNGDKGAWRPKHEATVTHRAAAANATEEAMRSLGIAEPWERAVASERWYFARRGRRDGLNARGALKATFDGIVDAGLLADDDSGHLTHGDQEFGIDPAAPRVEVTLRRL